MELQDCAWYQEFLKRHDQVVIDTYDSQMIWEIPFDGCYDVAEAHCFLGGPHVAPWSNERPGVMELEIVMVGDDAAKYVREIACDYENNGINVRMEIKNVKALSEPVEEYTHKAVMVVVFPLFEACR